MPLGQVWVVEQSEWHLDFLVHSTEVRIVPAWNGHMSVSECQKLSRFENRPTKKVLKREVA